MVINLRALRLMCGASISDVQRLTGASRTTLYALEAGKHVRDTTAVRILKALAKSSKFAKAHADIEVLLRREGVTRVTARSATEVLDRLDDIIIDVGTLGANQGKVDFARLDALVADLVKVAKNLRI
jgi:DNA-binding XRE family transcriptional regulator